MPNSNTHPLAGEKLLVVEDEILIALDIEATLVDAGADVVGLFTTIREASSFVPHGGYTAAVLDIRVGTETSYDIALHLHRRHIPFVFCSGQTLSEEMRAKLPKAILLRKPVLPGDLVDGILQAIRQIRPQPVPHLVFQDRTGD